MSVWHSPLRSFVSFIVFAWIGHYDCAGPGLNPQKEAVLGQRNCAASSWNGVLLDSAGTLKVCCSIRTQGTAEFCSLASVYTPAAESCFSLSPVSRLTRLPPKDAIHLLTASPHQRKKKPATCSICSVPLFCSHSRRCSRGLFITVIKLFFGN